MFNMYDFWFVPSIAHHLDIKDVVFMLYMAKGDESIPNNIYQKIFRREDIIDFIVFWAERR